MPKSLFPLTIGPVVGVNDAADLGEQSEHVWQDALNGYAVDGPRGAGWYQRPGYATPSTQYGPASHHRGQAIHHHVGLDGTVVRLFFVGGRVYRWNGTAAAFGEVGDNVTPVANWTVSQTARMYCVSVGNSVFVHDGTNRPVLLSNLTSTPVTAAAVDYDGAATAWVAQGNPVLYAGKVVVAVKSVGGVAYGNTIAWSEEFAPATGWQQTGYDNAWDLVQNGTDPVYGLWATNSALYYFRERSIGQITGAIDATFQTTATHDSVSQTVGTKYAATIVPTGTAVFFADLEGKPWRLAEGGTPEPIWQQMRLTIRQAYADGASTMLPLLSTFACGGFNPNLGVVKFALFSAGNTTDGPNTLYVFDANTGRYFGREAIMNGTTLSVTTGVRFSCLGFVENANGEPVFVALGTNAGQVLDETNDGRPWMQYRVSADIWNDGLLNIEVDVTTPLVEAPPNSEVVVQRATLEGRHSSSYTTAVTRLVYTTSRGTSSGQNATLHTAADQSYHGQTRAVWGLGPNSSGRWWRATLSYLATSSFDVQYGIDRLTLTGRTRPATSEAA